MKTDTKVREALVKSGNVRPAGADPYLAPVRKNPNSSRDAIRARRAEMKIHFRSAR